ncbi:50S ribosomal protein L6 [Candidatus Woesearchaeota archaeon]|nr:50S ribosomal protein L6 [Candidatus Woesearchaeota archaeon]
MEKAQKKAKKELREEIELEGAEASVAGKIITVKGPKGELTRKIIDPRVKVEVADGKIKFFTAKAGNKERKSIGSLKAHVKNMVKGTKEGHTYKLKICSSHFPMTVTATEKELSVKNFLGEKVPRKLGLHSSVKVKVEGSELIVESTDKEAAGRCAAAIERLTKRVNYDRRIFQDGIYITEKP